MVPPVRPSRRLASRNEAGERAGDAVHQAGRDDAQAAALDPDRRRGGADRVTVGVDDERAVGADLDGLAAQELDVGRVEVGALEHLGQLAQEGQLGSLLGDEHVELAVVELGLGQYEHAAAVCLRVADRDREAGVGVALAVDPTVKRAGLQAPARAGRRRGRPRCPGPTWPRWRSGWRRSRSRSWRCRERASRRRWRRRAAAPGPPPRCGPPPPGRTGPRARAQVVAAPAGDHRQRGIAVRERPRAGAAARRPRARPRSRPGAAAWAAASAACSVLRVVTVRCGASRRSSSACTREAP